MVCLLLLCLFVFRKVEQVLFCFKAFYFIFDYAVQHVGS